MKLLARTAVLLAAAILLAAAAVQGQERWNVELRAGAGIPADEPGEAMLDPGFGFDAALGVRVMPHLWAYGGWGWHHFGAEAVEWGGEADLEQTGYRFGLRWEHPLTGEDGPGLSYWVLAGGTMEHFEVESPGGDPVTDTDHGLGWEAGLGLSVPIWGGWMLTPGARYRALSRELAFGDLAPEVYTAYVALDVGLSRAF